MGLTTNDDQEEFRGSLRALFVAHADRAALRTTIESGKGYDPELYRLMCQQAGLAGLVVPERYGGSGYGFLELSVALEESGRALVCSPFFASAVLAAQTLLASADAEAMERFLPALAAGTMTATASLSEGPAGWGRAAAEVHAEPHDGEWRLRGSRTHVLDGADADLLLVTAMAPQGASVFAVEAGAAGLSRIAMSPLDLTRPMAVLELAETPATLVGGAGSAPQWLPGVFHRVCAAIAADQVGGAQRVLELTVDHVSSRKQFGRPIGSFQAVKHACADMVVDVESARAAAAYAVSCAAEDDKDLPVAAALAKRYVGDAYYRVGALGIQLHGGLGFSWDHDIHLFFKRATASRLLFGSPSELHDTLNELVAL